MPRHKIFSKRQVEVEGISVQVTRKNIKNLNLRVYPADKVVKVSVPRRAPENAVIDFLEAKMPWIKKHLTKPVRSPQKKELQFTQGGEHQVWGETHILTVIEKNQTPKVYIDNSGFLVMRVRPGTSRSKRESILKEWYRERLKTEIPKLIEKWEPIMGVKVNEFGVKKMKTRWGTCNIRAGRIWLNLELAKNVPLYSNM